MRFSNLLFDNDATLVTYRVLVEFRSFCSVVFYFGGGAGVGGGGGNDVLSCSIDVFKISFALA